MVTYAPNPRTWSDLEIPPYSTWNQDLYATWQFLLNPPMVKARQTTLQAVGNITWSALNFQVNEIDNYGFHSLSSPSLFVPTVPGYYVGYAGASFASTNAGLRTVAVAMNGGNAANHAQNLFPTTGTNMVLKGGTCFGPWYFSGYDYIQVMVYQNSGVTINTDVGAGSIDYEECPEFYMRWVSK